MCCLTRPASTASATTGSRRTGTSATGSSWSWTRSARPPWTPSARRRTCVRHGTASSRTRCGRQRRDSEPGSDCPRKKRRNKKAIQKWNETSCTTRRRNGNGPRRKRRRKRSAKRRNDGATGNGRAM
uniref:(northern house mosquito) hypothetical protein n=1 Tax=Culex pipiens TaxID=7175 RepID=A0A8D8FTN8_CULPI